MHALQEIIQDNDRALHAYVIIIIIIIICNMGTRGLADIDI